MDNKESMACDDLSWINEMKYEVLHYLTINPINPNNIPQLEKKVKLYLEKEVL